MVAHDGGGAVEEGGDFVVGAVGEDFGEEVGVVAPAGFDEELLGGGALDVSVCSSPRSHHQLDQKRRLCRRTHTSCSSLAMASGRRAGQHSSSAIVCLSSDCWRAPSLSASVGFRCFYLARVGLRARYKSSAADYPCGEKAAAGRCDTDRCPGLRCCGDV